MQRDDTSPPDDNSSNAGDIACIGAALRRTANLVTRIYNAHLAPAGLEVTQYSILRKIEAGTAGSASELAELVGVERSTLARNLERLEKLGLISAQAGEGRRLIYQLTPEGAARVEAAIPLWREAQMSLVEGLPQDKARIMLDELALLRRAARAAHHTNHTANAR